MADIAMCRNKLCPRNKECYRAQANPCRWQSYANFNYRVTDNGAICDGFISFHKTTTTSGTEGWAK